MQIYSTEELLELKPSAQAPQEFDFVSFSTMIAELKEKLEKKHATEGENKFTFRRRSSRHESRPLFAKKNHRKHEQPKVDADGWVTFNKAGHKKSVTHDDDLEVRDDFRENHKAASLVKAKPNTKRIGTRAAADSREAASEVRNNTFNAFSALGSDEEDEDDEAIEEEEEAEEKEEEN